MNLGFKLPAFLNEITKVNPQFEFPNSLHALKWLTEKGKLRIIEENILKV